MKYIDVYPHIRDAEERFNMIMRIHENFSQYYRIVSKAQTSKKGCTKLYAKMKTKFIIPD